MDKEILEKVLKAVVNDYLKRKEEISEQEFYGYIGSDRANQQRSKLIGMNYAMDVVKELIEDIE